MQAGMGEAEQGARKRRLLLTDNAHRNYGKQEETP